MALKFHGKELRKNIVKDPLGDHNEETHKKWVNTGVGHHPKGQCANIPGATCTNSHTTRDK